MTTCLLLSLLLPAQTDTAVINRYVLAELERQRIPGLSLAVLAGDRVLISRGYGFANVELRVPATDSTVYQSGSMGKQFAASRPLDFRPGERWSYSNTGYVLLGALIHRVTGRFYGDLLRDSVFRPLGMNDSRVISEADIVPNRAAGYRLEGGALKNQEWVAPSLNTTADGALYFTIRDLIRWGVALNHHRVPNPALLDSAWTPVRLNDGATYPYGFGWGVFNQRGALRISHGGSWQGFKTVIARYPESGLTVIVLANLAQ